MFNIIAKIFRRTREKQGSHAALPMTDLQPTALYTYLDETLKSPYYRKILEDGRKAYPAEHNRAR